ncbi:glycosyltransferase family 39 protein [Flavisolibacter ginsenosidimutans]|uniref:Glycosyltransferase family 39 protein n=1 Tax=Flavisolibacter ginsenosidimutans TaxID=661481 RepID=A0A5B8UL16_9BACT|nr:glycosyltransferase family 39 protein [Flavisolibacter ginsenosidimutans]QEC57357.1 glycosyltransferase family 39 protein [Flavisolibacter ginsenosidimutans]
MLPLSSLNTQSSRPSFFANANRYRKPLVFLFFLGVLLLGLFIYRDYGISADEGISRTNAVITAKYLVQRFVPAYAKSDSVLASVPNLHQWKDRDYGVAFELPAYLLEKALRLKDPRSIHFLHHLCIFLVFWVGLWFFYLLAKERFNSWKVGLVGAILLLLSPRIFADAFYNSKDLVFMSFFIVSLYTLVRFLKSPNWRLALLHALACAITIDVRIMGILLPLATVAIFVIDAMKNNSNLPMKKRMAALVLYSALLVCIVILFWPFLWEAPLSNFLLAFKNMSKFRWNNEVLYMGHITHAANLPWHYGPVWITITTPVVYTLLFLLGSILIVKNILANRLHLYRNNAQKLDVIFLAFFYLPLAAVIVLHSILYDGWRHLFFLYPAFLLLALRGLVSGYAFLQKKRMTWPLRFATVVFFASLLRTVFFMITAHPYQNVYFSFLPAKTVEKNFERDYWGLSFRKSMEFVMNHDKSDTVYLQSPSTWAEQNSELLKKEDQQRVRWINFDDSVYTAYPKSVYFLTEFRAHPQPFPFPNEIYSQEVHGLKIASVYKIK